LDRRLDTYDLVGPATLCPLEVECVNTVGDDQTNMFCVRILFVHDRHKPRWEAEFGRQGAVGFAINEELHAPDKALRRVLHKGGVIASCKENAIQPFIWSNVVSHGTGGGKASFLQQPRLVCRQSLILDH
jgi:hypothetical protein